jgi:hypothetical protein
MAGTTTRATSANGTHPVGLADRVVRAVALTVTWRRPGRAVS